MTSSRHDLPADPPAEPRGTATGHTSPDARIPLAGRILVATLGATAVALGGAGLAYASGVDDSHWVTVVEDDPPRNCPEKDAAGGGL